MARAEIACTRAAEVRGLVPAVAGSRQLLDDELEVRLHRFGLAATLHELGHAKLRDAPQSPDGGVIADYTGAVGDPASLTQALDAVPGVIEHGLFPPTMVSEVLVGQSDSVQRMEVEA